MNLQNKLQELVNILPFKAEEELLEEILLKSSHIDFTGEGEKLFKAGDPPLGFYWILSGQVETVIPNKALLNLREGDMAGLDCFLNKETHPFNVVTASPQVKTIFINRPCFDHFREKPDFRRLINSQVLYHLFSYKSLLYSPSDLLLK